MGQTGPVHRLVLHDTAVDDAHDTAGIAGDIPVVGDHDDCLTPAVQFLKNGHDLQAGAGIEVAGGFIGQQDFRLVYQRPGDGHPLLLAAGKLCGLVGKPFLPDPTDRKACSASSRTSERSE